MFYVRLNKVKVLNNRELVGKAEIQFMSFINSGNDDFPMLGDFFTTNDQNQKKAIIKEAATKVLGSRVTPQIQMIRDNQSIYFGDTGYNLYTAEAIPQDFNWLFMAVKLNQSKRDAALLVDELLTENDITKLVGAIGALASLSNPVTASIALITDFVAKGIIKFYQNEKDKQLGILLTSFIQQLHYPYGKRDAQDVKDLTGNMLVDYTIFGF